MRITFILFTFLVLVTPTWACELKSGDSIPTIIFPAKHNSKSPKTDYVFQLLQLILDKSKAKYGPCRVTLPGYTAPLKRMQYYLENGTEIDVIALTVSAERDERLMPIRIPISKGLVGYRVLMINKENEPLFSKVNTLEELRKLVAGQGTGWPDVEILKQNGLPVTTSGSVKTLVQMLEHGRFDYFPQGALQIGKVLQTISGQSLSIASSLLISYPSMTALYVNKADIKLAERIEYGLKLAYDDGSFDRFFNSHPSSQLALSYLDIDNKKVIYLCNIYAPDWLPLNDEKYWLKPWPKFVSGKQC